MTVEARAGIRVGIDVGGTFTDFVALIAGGEQRVHLKEPSTPHDPSLAVVTGLRRLLGRIGARPEDVISIAHGTTIGLNAIIQRRGADIALVISSGHRDVLELTRRLPFEYDLRQPRISGLVPRDRVIEVAARLDAAGNVVEEPDDAEIERVARLIRASGAGAVALVVLHSYRVPEFETAIAARLAAALPGVPVTGSATIWPEIREYNRASAVTMNAYIAPLITAYLDGLEHRLDEAGITAPLYLTANNGGSIGVGTARERPIETILSGPASGVTASLLLARENGLNQLVSFDMGGTSSDIALAVDGAAEVATRSEVGGLPLVLPVTDVSAIGAGGGSIAWIDEQGELHVGPESAGAVPGPAAYGLGGERPTVTDAYLVAGILDHDGLLGGTQSLDLARARTALETLAPGLGHDGADAAERAAADVIAVATVGMAAGMQKVLARRGFEAAEFTIVPFGGAGPTHAALLAEEIGAASIHVPLAAGTYCALGAVGSRLRRDYLRGIGRPLDDETASLAVELLEELARTCRDWVSAQGQGSAAEVQLRLELRYTGQAFELDVPVDVDELPLDAASIAEAFHTRHEGEFGHRDLSSPIVLISAKATAIGAAPPLAPVRLPAAPAEAAQTPTREIFLAGRRFPAAVFTEAELSAAFDAAGPAVIDLPNTTVLVPPGWRAAAGTGESLRLTRSIRITDETDVTEGAA